MRKLNFLKMMLLAVVMLVGSVGVFGQTTYSHTFTSAVFSTSNYTSPQSLSEKNWLMTPVWNNNAFFGYESNRGLQIGSKNDPALSYILSTSDFSDKIITSVVVTANGYNTTPQLQITVGTVSNTPTNLATGTTPVAHIWSGSESGDIKISMIGGAADTRAVYIKSITVTYSEPTTPITSAPTFSPSAGTYTSAQNVELSSTTAGANIYYTTNGDEPTSASSLYTGAIPVSTTTTIKAIAYDENGENPSNVTSAEYVIDLNPNITVTPATTTAMTDVEVGKTASRTLTINGSNLTDDLNITLSGDNVDQFSLSGNTIPQLDGNVSDAKVTITYTPQVAGSHTVVVDISHGSTSLFTRTISGTAVYPPLAQPIATDATNITSDSFTANWVEIEGATEYELDVYTVATTGTVIATDLFFSEYVEGSGSNKYLEIYNGTGVDVDLSAYKVVLYANGSATASNINELTGNLANGKTLVLKNSGAKIYSEEATVASTTNYNGNDAIALMKGDAFIDIIGSIGHDPGTAWTATGGYSTLDKTLVRKPTVTGGVTVNPATGFPTLASEWDVYNIDVVSNLGSHTLTDQLMETTTHVTGSPFTATTNSFNITGLESSTTHYYTVVAKNANVTSEISNLIEVTTLSVPLYRSATSGVWSSIETWEVSTDNGSTWSAATEIPSQMAANISIQPDHLVTINSEATASTLIIQPKGMLTVGEEGTLETGNLQILSDATGTGTILNYGGVAEVQQYLASRRNWYMSVPVNEMTTAPTGFGYWYYDELTGASAWPTTTSLVAGKGYLVYPNEGITDGAITFNGILNSEDINVEMTRSSSNTTKPGYNLVGNPYPSYLDVSNLKNNTAIEPSLWYRTKTGSGNYVFDLLNLESGLATNPSGLAVTYEVPPMQAFWLRVAETETSATVNFLKSNRKHGSEPDVVKPPFRAPSAGQPEQSVLRLRVSNGIDADEAIIYFNGNALSGYDRYDSYKMSNGNLAIPEIYTLLNNKQVAINGMNAIPYDIPIALGFVTGTAGNLTITANEVQNFADNAVIILKDNVTGIETDLTKTPSYTFSSEALRTSERFSVIFPKSDVPTSVSENDISKFLTYTKEDQIIVQIDESLLDADMFVYNNVGQLIVTQKANSLENTINKSLLPGVYFVKIKNQTVKTMIR